MQQESSWLVWELNIEELNDFKSFWNSNAGSSHIREIPRAGEIILSFPGKQHTRVDVCSISNSNSENEFSGFLLPPPEEQDPDKPNQ